MLLSKITSLIIIPFYFIIAGCFLISFLLERKKLYIIAGMGIIIGVSLVATMLFCAIATDNASGFIDRIFIQPVKALVLPVFLNVNSSKQIKLQIKIKR